MSAFVYAVAPEAMVFGQGVTVTIKPCVLGERDNRGNYIKTWPESSWFEQEGVALAPRTSSETNNVGFANRVVIGLTLYGPYDLKLDSLDRVAVGGEDYEVVGEVGRWLNPYLGVQEGSEVALSRVKG